MTIPRFLKFQIVLLIVAACAYWNAPLGGYCYDDLTLTRESRGLESWSHFPKLFSEDYGPYFRDLSYRPISTLSFFSDTLLFEKTPFASRLISLLFHFFNGALFFVIWRRVFQRDDVAFLAAAFFLCHPITSEAVNCFAFRRDLLATFFTLLALCLLLKHGASGSLSAGLCAAAVWLLGLLSKETAVMLAALAPMVLVWAAEIQRNFPLLMKQASVRLVMAGGAFCAALAVFLLLYLSFSYEAPSGMSDGEAAAAAGIGAGWPGGKGWVLGFLNFCRTFLVYARLWGFPLHLSIGHEFQSSTSYSDSRIWLAGLVFACFAGLSLGAYLQPWFCRGNGAVKRSNGAIAGAGGLWVCFCLAPVAQIIPSPQILAERYVYMAHGGMALIFAAALVGLRDMPHLLRKDPSPSRFFHGFAWHFLVAGLLIACALLTSLRNLDWRDDMTLNIRRYELWEGAEGKLALGALYYGKKDKDRAAAYFGEAIALDPALADPRRNLGVIYMESGDYERAGPLLKSALELAPSDARNRKAMEYFRKGSEEAGRNPQKAESPGPFEGRKQTDQSSQKH